MALHDDDTNLDAGQASTPPDKVELTERARRLRRQMTFPERQLWSILRARRLGGFRFKRQHVAEPFILDFYCPELRLAIEVDGLSHEGRGEADRRREALLYKHGICVVRVTNDEVLKAPDAVAEYILHRCREREREAGEYS